MSAASVPPLYGLILAGGRSSRMGTDKALLKYHGKNQIEWTAERARAVCERVFLSVRPDQVDDPARAKLPQIVDQVADKGPIAGIMAAQAEAPHVAWLVLACDLPFVDEDTLRHLAAARDPSRVATAYRSTHDGLPEPLCAIFEPKSRALDRTARRERQGLPAEIPRPQRRAPDRSAESARARQHQHGR